MSEEVPEIAVSLLRDSVAVRIYDGEKYLFISPIGLADGWDIKGALDKIRAYAVKEMIPLIFTDVPRDSIDSYCEVFRYCRAEVYGDDDDLFFIEIDNECSLLDKIPTARSGNLSLSEIGNEDLEAYARLARDKELNKYWGYDVTEDNIEDKDEYFLDVARGEFNTGTAITLGVYLDFEFVGEAVIYDLDYKGGASIALRILPEHQGRGLGKRTLSLLISVADKIDLITLYGEAMEENLPSIGMTSHFMDIEKRENGRVYFKKTLR